MKINKIKKKKKMSITCPMGTQLEISQIILMVSLL